MAKEILQLWLRSWTLSWRDDDPDDLGGPSEITGVLKGGEPFWLDQREIWAWTKVQQELTPLLLALGIKKGYQESKGILGSREEQEKARQQILP